MTRPNIIRADTIDLQEPNAPSAKDHTRQPNRPSALGDGPPAPHQADALKHVEIEISEQHGRSPRASQDLSGKELGLLHHEDGETYGANDSPAQDTNNLIRNTGSNGAAEEEMADADGDDSEDDMMDKISSSPSIGDDGGYHLQLPFPRRGSSLRPSTPPNRRSMSPGALSDVLSSSPFCETPEHFPLSFPRNEQDRSPSKDHHHQGGFTRSRLSQVTVDELESELRDQLGPLASEQGRHDFNDEGFDDLEESYEGDFDPNDFRHLLVPEDDSLLDNSFDDVEHSSTESSPPISQASWDENDKPETNDDDTEEISFVDNSRFIDSGWGGECLRETEDIDFEFVYALHTFVATVEGQANATKGDTMVLLDDSNSYWWLVRVVKDSSIGYLPAEHIETPLERLARLNKHRNLDLSQTMLGDEEERKPGATLNPLKKAMRRRNTKQVQFTAPSYVEPSDVEYSTDEDDEGNSELFGDEQDGATNQQNDQDKDIEQSAVVEPLKPRGANRDNRRNGEVAESNNRNGGLGPATTPEDVRESDEILDRSDDGTAGKSRKGTVRNTDSFFKDDSVETRKITITPNLLRDDSKGPSVTSIETNDQLKARPSIDSLEKDAPTDKGKEDKKRKEKKGMLGGMFRRKDKKSKGQDRETEEVDNISHHSGEVSRLSPQPKESLESLTPDPKSTPQPHKQTSKLQKSPPAKLSPKSSYTLREPAGAKANTADQQPQYATIPEPSRAPPTISEPNSSMRMVQPEQDIVTEDTVAALNFNPPAPTYNEPPQQQADSPRDGRRGMFSPIKDVLKSSPSQPKPEKARPAKNRMRMDDFDSTSSEDEPTEQALSERESQDEPERHLAIAQEAQHEAEPPAPTISPNEPVRERLSESPIEVTPPQDFPRSPQQDYQHISNQEPHPVSPQQSPPRPLHQPPPLIIDTSSPENPSTSPISPSSSPELINAPSPNISADEIDPTNHNKQQPRAQTETPASTAQSCTPTWSDASLRAYLEDDSEIKDLLLVVHDKSNVKPARRDHPIVKSMYREERGKLGEISKNLDGLLGGYLARRGGGRSASAGSNSITNAISGGGVVR